MSSPVSIIDLADCHRSQSSMNMEHVTEMVWREMALVKTAPNPSANDCTHRAEVLQEWVDPPPKESKAPGYCLTEPCSPFIGGGGRERCCGVLAAPSVDCLGRFFSLILRT